MPWEKQFDVDEALNRALAAFWAEGYEATSMQQLLDAMGLNRGSFYDTFGSKHNALLQALNRYGETVIRPALTGACSGRTPRAMIEAVFDWVVAEALGKAGSRGCLFVNTALEMAPRDPEVSRVVGRAFEEMETFFRSSIEQGQAVGEISGNMDAAATAKSLMAMLLGLRVMARSGASRDTLQAVAAQVSTMLRE